jgi:hypothetical protein
MDQERLPDNAAPTIFAVKTRSRELTAKDFDESIEDPIDSLEVFDYIRDINDPEHPYTLEQLNVVQVLFMSAYLSIILFLGRTNRRT